MQIIREGVSDPRSMELNPINFSSIAGKGDKKKICIRMRHCGIGDNLHAMPAISWLVENGYDVTVISKSFSKLCWESCGAKFLDVETNRMTDLLDYGEYYILNQWSVWEESTLGYSPRSRFELFASLVRAELPNSFSWIERLKPAKLECKYVIFAPESSSPWRTFSKLKSYKIYRALKKKYKQVLWLGDNKSRVIETLYSVLNIDFFSAKTFRGLMACVYNSKGVVGIDSGIINLAAAFEKPLIGVFGITDGDAILKQFARYVNMDAKVIQTEGVKGKCTSPCWQHPKNGFTNDKCCGVHDQPMCMKNIKIEDIV